MVSDNWDNFGTRTSLLFTRESVFGHSMQISVSLSFRQEVRL